MAALGLAMALAFLLSDRGRSHRDAPPSPPADPGPTLGALPGGPPPSAEVGPAASPSRPPAPGPDSPGSAPLDAALAAPPAAAGPAPVAPPGDAPHALRETQLTLRSTPQAVVSQAGTILGQTPLELDLSPGAHRFELAAPGHRPLSVVVEATGGQALTHDLVLERLPAP